MTSSQQPERKNAFQSWVERIVQKLMIALIPLIGARFLCDAQHRWPPVGHLCRRRSRSLVRHGAKRLRK
jgi:hypothetical protein